MDRYAHGQCLGPDIPDGSRVRVNDRFGWARYVTLRCTTRQSVLHHNPLALLNSPQFSSIPPNSSAIPPAMALRLVSKRVFRSALLPRFRASSSAASSLPPRVQAEILVFSFLLPYCHILHSTTLADHPDRPAGSPAAQCRPCTRLGLCTHDCRPRKVHGRHIRPAAARVYERQWQLPVGYGESEVYRLHCRDRRERARPRQSGAV